MTHRLDHHSIHLTSCNLFHHPAEHHFFSYFHQVAMLLDIQASVPATVQLHASTFGALDIWARPNISFIVYAFRLWNSIYSMMIVQLQRTHRTAIAVICKRRWEKIAVGQAWLAAHWSCWRQHFLGIGQVPNKDVKPGSITEKSHQLSWES